jgi:SAM-dependent methyltransferase
VPAHDNGSIQLYQSSLTTREQREFARAERTIAKGLKSFLAVGMALKQIRDNRLYRQRYGTFEEYCARRWDFSRPRAYALCAASEVIADLSPIGDIRLLPENEAQARPLTRLKAPEHRQRAWEMAVEMAAAEERPVTARDTEEAVRRLDGNGRIEPAWADGEPVYTCVQGTNADLIATVARLYLRKGDRVADITFGQGAFWQKLNLSDYLFYRSDKVTCPGSAHDFRRLPYPDRRFDVVVFDPPYAHHADTMRFESFYKNSITTAKLGHREIIDLYRLGMAEAKRILKPGGRLWVKCADEVESSRQRRGHVEVFLVAQDLGLEDLDFFILMQETPPATNGKRQRHARKNCSFLWVFRKPRA